MISSQRLISDSEALAGSYCEVIDRPRFRYGLDTGAVTGIWHRACTGTDMSAQVAKGDVIWLSYPKLQP